MSQVYLELEQRIIGLSLASEQDFLDYADEKIKPDDFSCKLHSNIWSALSKGWVDSVALCESFKELQDHWNDIVQLALNAIKTQAHSLHAAKLKDRARVRKISAVLAQALNEHGQGSDIESMLGMISGAQNDNYEVGGIEHINYSLKTSLDNMEERHNNRGKPMGLMTGIDIFDSRINGFRGGDLWVVAGRPGMGKTAMLMSVVKHHMNATNSNSLIFSLEMQKEQLTDRLISSVGRIDSIRMRDGGLEDDDWQKLTVAISKIKDKSISIDDTAGLDIDTLILRAKAHHRKNPITFVGIDYLQLIRLNGSKSEYETVTECSRRLKELAKALDCPVMILSQLNRDVEKRNPPKPVSSDLRASGAIEQDADVITFLYRDEVYDENTTDKGIVELITTKFRNGSTGMDKAAAVMQYTSFENLTRNY